MRVSILRIFAVAMLTLAACGPRPAPPPTGTAPAVAVVSPTTAATQAPNTPVPAATATQAPVFTASPVVPTTAPILTPPANPCQEGGATAASLALSYTGASENGPGASVYLVRADGSQRTEYVRGGLAGAWSPNGQRLAYYVETGDRQQPYSLRFVSDDGRGDTAVALDAVLDSGHRPVWSPDGQYLSVDSPNGGVFVVDVDSGQARNVAGEVALAYGPVWSPDGGLLAFQAPLDTTLNNQYRIHTVRPDGTELTRLESDTLNDIVQQWQPDGSRLLVKSGGPPGGPQQIYLLSADGLERQWLFGGQSYADNIAWSPNGQQMAYLAFEIHFDAQGNITGSTQWINLADANGANVRMLEQLNLVYGQPGLGVPQWSPDGRYLAFTRELIDTAADLFVLDLCTNQYTQVASSVFGQPAWKPGAAPLPGVLVEAAVPTATPASGPVTQVDYANRLAWSPDGQTLVAGTGAGARFYAVGDWSEAAFLRWQAGCCTLAALNGAYLATVDGNGTGVSVYNWQDRSLVFEQRDAADLDFHSLALSPDGTLLATGERFQTRLWNLSDGSLLAALQTSDVADAQVTAVELTADGRTLVSVTQFQGMVHQWDVASLSLRRSFRVAGVTSFVLAAGGRQLLADYAQPGFELWDAVGGFLLSRHPLIIGGGGPNFTALSANSRQAAVWGYRTDQGSTLAVWDVTNNRQLHTMGLGADTDPAVEWRSAAFSPDGATLALGDTQGHIYLLETATWTEVGRINVPAIVGQ